MFSNNANTSGGSSLFGGGASKTTTNSLFGGNATFGGSGITNNPTSGGTGLFGNNTSSGVQNPFATAAGNTSAVDGGGLFSGNNTAATPKTGIFGGGQSTACAHTISEFPDGMCCPLVLRFQLCTAALLFFGVLCDMRHLLRMIAG